MKFTEFKENYQQLKSKSEREDFLQLRLSELISSSVPNNIGKNHCGSYSGFIGPNTILFSNGSNFFSGLVFDDFHIYQEFFDFINQDFDTYLHNEPMTIGCIQQFVWKYFGVHSGSTLDRMDIYSPSDMKPVSITSFKGNNLAACSERSALVQNLLVFMGFESEIIFGKLNNDSSHAYIIFSSQNGNTKLLYDPMNPVTFHDDNTTSYGFAVSKMSEEEYQDLKNGKSYTFDYSQVKKLYGKTNCSEDKREYGCDSYLYSHHKNI